MSTNGRITAFGGAGVLVLAGIACGLVFGGLLGPVLAFVFIASGLVLATSLVFLEVGLSEDRERDRELARVQRRAQRAAAGRRVHRPRMRSHRREL